MANNRELSQFANVVGYNGGNIGIGTDDPDERLEVGDGTVSGALKVSGQSSSVTSDGFTVDWESSSNSTRFFSEPSSGGSSAIRFFTTNSGTRAEKLRITSVGRVGINSIDPATALDIQSTKNSDGLTVTKAGTRSAFLGHNGSGTEGLLTLKEGGTTTVQLYAETNQDSYINSGDFGIGTNSPSTKLDVRPTAEDPTTGSPAAGSFLQVRADDATVGKGPSLALMNLSGSKETGWRLSALTASGNNGDFTIHGYGGGATYSERLRILSGGGITFNGDTAAANALDDYEEGTWTPTVTPSSGSFTTAVYNSRDGYYTKIGRMVHIQIIVNFSSFNRGSASGTVSITGLPFTRASGFTGIMNVAQCNNWVNPPSGGIVGSSSITLSENATCTGFNNDFTEVSDMGTTTENRIHMDGWYVAT